MVRGRHRARRRVGPEFFYDRLAEAGYGVRQSGSRGLRGAWRAGRGVFAKVARSGRSKPPASAELPRASSVTGRFAACPRARQRDGATRRGGAWRAGARRGRGLVGGALAGLGFLSRSRVCGWVAGAHRCCSCPRDMDRDRAASVLAFDEAGSAVLAIAGRLAFGRGERAQSAGWPRGTRRARPLRARWSELTGFPRLHHIR